MRKYPAHISESSGRPRARSNVPRRMVLEFSGHQLIAVYPVVLSDGEYAELKQLEDFVIAKLRPNGEWR